MIECLQGQANRTSDLLKAIDEGTAQLSHDELIQMVAIAFGHGIHFCSGAALVRLEARVALEQLSARLPSLRLVPDREAIYEPMLLARGLKHLPVEWDG